MPDQPFVDFAYASAATGAVPRKETDRLSDIFNVRDFAPSGTTDWTLPTQKAINAAVLAGGGTIFFPPGGYGFSARVTVPVSPGHGLDFLGCGSDVAGAGASGGTALLMNVQDYIIYTGHYSGSGAEQTPIKSIRGIGFKNDFNSTVPTTTEPIGGAGGGFGCIYLGCGVNPVIDHCSLSVSAGIGIFSAARNIHVGHTNMQGGLVIGDWNRSILLFMSGGGFYGHAKPYAAGHCLVAVHKSCSFRNIDCEISGYGVRIGSSPIAWWNPTTLSVKSAGDASEAVDCCSMHCIGFESMKKTVMDIRNVQRGSFVGLANENHEATFPETYVYLRNVHNSEFRLMACSGAFSSVLWDMAGTGSQNVSGNIFENCGGVGGTAQLAPCTSFAAGDDPNIFVASFTSAVGLTIAQLPISPTIPYSEPILVTNCSFPIWVGPTTSNAGRPIGSTTGSNSILARWNGTAWIAAG